MAVTLHFHAITWRVGQGQLKPSRACTTQGLRQANTQLHINTGGISSVSCEPARARRSSCCRQAWPGRRRRPVSSGAPFCTPAPAAPRQHPSWRPPCAPPCCCCPALPPPVLSSAAPLPGIHPSHPAAFATLLGFFHATQGHSPTHAKPVHLLCCNNFKGSTESRCTLCAASSKNSLASVGRQRF